MRLYERTLNVFLESLLSLVLLFALTNDYGRDQPQGSLPPLAAALPAIATTLPQLPADPLVPYGVASDIQASIDDRGAHLLTSFTRPINFSIEAPRAGLARVLLYPVDGPSVSRILAEAMRAGLSTDVELLARFSYRVTLSTSPDSSMACGGGDLELAGGSSEGTAARLSLEFVPARRGASGRSAASPSPPSLRVSLEHVEKTRVRPSLLFDRYLVHARDGAVSHASCLTLDPSDPSLQLGLGTASGGMRVKTRLSQIARESGAIAALNASFFAPSGDPLGILIEDGQLVSVPILGRTSIGLYQRTHILFGNPIFSGKLVLSDGQLEVVAVNEKREDGGLVVYTPRFGKSTRTVTSGLELAVLGDHVVSRASHDAAIPPGGFVVAVHGNEPAPLARLHAGDPLSFHYGLTPPWNLCDLAVGGGPRLVQGGEPQVSAADERFARGFDTQRAPRSAIGVTRDGHLVLVALDGRHPPRDSGVTLVEMAHVMLALGARDAMNLDGGGSTTMVVSGQVVNRPSDLREREISTGLLILPARGGETVASRMR